MTAELEAQPFVAPALRAVSQAALPPVAEEGDGRRARVANLLRRLRERQEGKEVADQADGSGTRDVR